MQLVEKIMSMAIWDNYKLHSIFQNEYMIKLTIPNDVMITFVLPSKEDYITLPLQINLISSDVQITFIPLIKKVIVKNNQDDSCIEMKSFEYNESFHSLQSYVEILPYEWIGVTRDIETLIRKTYKPVV